MKEELLHFVWRHKMFPMHNLKTVDGLPIQIIIAGEYNTNAGPDFLNAQIFIGDTLWAGHVEMHINATDWDAHHHSADHAYDNVILHVVYHDNNSLTIPKIPVLEISSLISEDTKNGYQKIRDAKTWIPCQHSIQNVSELTKNIWLERMLIERLETKADDIKYLLNRNGGDWAETAYQWMAKSFGFSVNAKPFIHLAENLPLKVMMKHAENPFQLEALLFGTSGFLNEDFVDEYPIQLKKEFTYLSFKYNIIPIQVHEWKLLRMRPDNFPCIRISQFSKLMMMSDRLFSKLLALRSMKEVYDFLDVKASAYWNNHYRFEVISEKSHSKFLGNGSKDLFIINTLVPLVFAYGLIKDQKKYMEQALALLNEIKPEQNHIIRGWKDAEVNCNSAWHSQALLHLKKHYCDVKRCLDCSIGVNIIKKAPIVKNQMNTQRLS